MADFYETFNSTRYGGASAQRRGEDDLANKGMKISFSRLGTDIAGTRDETIHFKAFITTFNETYSPGWKSDNIYGRADAIPIYRNTRRKISLAFKIPATTSGEAYENLGKLQKLIQFLYPSYMRPANNSFTQIISRSPFVRLKMMNLLRDTTNINTQTADRYDTVYNSYNMVGKGILGAITSLNVEHHLNDGEGVVEKGTSQEGLQAILSKYIEVNLSFEPIHEHPLGWDVEGKFGVGSAFQMSSTENDVFEAKGETFPYGISLVENAQTLDEVINELVYDEDGSEFFSGEDDDELPTDPAQVAAERLQDVDIEDLPGEDSTMDEREAWLISEGYGYGWDSFLEDYRTLQRSEGP